MKKKIENKSGWLIGGGIVASIIASLCCVGPLVLTIIGVSGAAVVSKFDIVRIPMILLVISLFGIAGLTLYRKRIHCELGLICVTPKKHREMIIFYWIGFVISLLAITSPLWIAWLFS